jgi:hypothetical protein
MINILIDSQSIVDKFPKIAQSDIDDLKKYTVKRLTSNFYEKWMAEAGRQLHSTRNHYQKSLIVVDEGKFSGAVMLTNFLPNAVESGLSAFDLKEGFKRSDKVKIKKSKDGIYGWYLTIPFRMATPGAVGESEFFSEKMPMAIYNLVKDSSTDIPNSTGTRSKGISLSDLKNVPEFLSRPRVRPEVANAERVFEEYVNKTSVYEGLSKMKDYMTGQNTYGSFRRVSSNSDPNSWIHTGILAHNIMDKALNKFDIEKEAAMAQDMWLSNILGI